MNKLSDLEICKRIAEIEGLESRQCGNVECAENHYITDNAYCDETRHYNPLTDDALCFKLMVKYGVLFTPVIPNIKIRDYSRGNYKPETYMANSELNQSPNKAICLAIIEANKHKGSK